MESISWMSFAGLRNSIRLALADVPLRAIENGERFQSLVRKCFC
jgi:hypothetical protein